MHTRRLTAVIVATAAAIVVAGAPGASARPSGTAGPALSGPTAVHVGDAYTIEGSGFKPGSIVPLEIGEAGGCCIALNLVADAGGRFSYTGEAWAAGTYRVRAMTQRNGGRWRVAASWSFEAYP